MRGFRIELGEIEANLLNHAAVARAVVMLREDLPGQTRLVAYVVPEGRHALAQSLREHLRRWLPDHMVPGLFVELTTIPVLPNGKTNRQALPVPAAAASGLRTHHLQRLETPPKQPFLPSGKQTLQIDQLGIHDNFFDLGGHSILAVGVVSRIETALQRPCALALLFKHPTVAGLSSGTRAGTAGKGRRRRAGCGASAPWGRRQALFLLAGAEMYRQLAKKAGFADAGVWRLFAN